MHFKNQMSYQLINDFIINFLTRNVSQEVISKWLDDDIQENFNRLIKSKTAKFTCSSNKKEKNFNLPKRGKSPYIFFSCENQSIVKENNPHMDNKQIMSELGRLWRELDKESVEVKRYNKMSSEDHERFKKEKSEIINKELEEKPKKEKNAKKQSGYNLFCKEKRIELKKEGNMTDKEIREKINITWKNMTDEEKQEFKNKV